MTCYHPMLRFETYEQYTCQDGHKAYKARVEKPDPKDLAQYENIEAMAKSMQGRYRRVQVIPCGKCIGCRLEYSKDWATKGCYEAETHKHNWFLTITYDQEHLPEADDMIGEYGEEICQNPNGTLKPSDFTNFLKRLRDFYKRKYNHEGIRFMGCGEYGSKGMRPHYHAIMFNLPIQPEKMKFHEYNANHEALWRVPELEKIWEKGMIVAAEVNWNTCAYVARYITKKVGLPTQEAYYKRLGIEPEFFRMSRRPGIGREYFEKHKDEIYASDNLVIKKYGGGTMKVKPPRYYDRLYDIENHEQMETIKKKRNANAERINHLRDSQTTLHRKEQLQLTEQSKKAQSKLLLRNKL